VTGAEGGAAGYRCVTEEETAALASDLARGLGPGDLVLLYGDLGAGKTAFVRGLAAGLGADADEVSSPTFTLMQEYRGRVVLRHLDLYRIDSAEEIAELGLDEAGADAVLAVEWAERLVVQPPDAWHVVIRIVDDATRDVTIVPPPRRLTPPGSSALPS
jgi:tRNA threonylcarbamoyladenosine biosynthesis protein TsaE